MSSEKNQDTDWLHIPDSVIDKCLQLNVERKVFDLVLNHLSTCTVCRDRYWERVERVHKARKDFTDELKKPAFPFTLPLLGGLASLPIALQEILAKAENMVVTNEEGEPSSLEEAVINLLSRAEKIPESDKIILDDLCMPDDGKHIRSCRPCRNKLVKACQQMKKAMPEKAKLIDRVVAMLEELGALEPAENEKTEKHDHGGDNSFAM